MPKQRILVLDDNQDILDVVHETLAYEHFEVKSINDGKNILSIVEEFAPHLLILDYRAGGLNGGEICKQIKSDPKFNTLPVIIFSAYINNSSEVIAYGCDAIINKPFDLGELVEKVNNLLT